MPSYKVVTYYWEKEHYLQRGLTYDGFATPKDAMLGLMEEAEKGFEYCIAFCLDEDTGESQWELKIN